MPSVYPEFYTHFACRAGACRHSCCRGWEIDVDERSAACYRRMPGPLGDALRRTLEADAEGWHFRLNADERCPFLRTDGLCRLICELGEESLCDICALHPRFFLDCGDWELCGLGLSCEAVAALLLQSDKPLLFYTEEESFSLPDLIMRLGYSFPEARLRFTPRPGTARYASLLAAMEQTEAIDDRWPEELAVLRASLPQLAFAAEDYARRYDERRYDRLFAYILYRQLPRLEERGAENLLRYAQACTEFIFLQDALEENTAEHLRRWSEQIEYSTENVDILLFHLY